MLRVILVGLGAIGQGLLPLLDRHPQDGAHAPLSVASRLQDLPPADLLVECAGHGAVVAPVLPALSAGTACVMASVGALARPGLAGELEAAALAGGTRLHLVAGAIGAIDALAAARLGGLDGVHYTGIKPALAWRGTPADGPHDLAALAAPALIFDGNAADAALAYPRNANVAATVALAGLGLDATRVRLWAAPQAAANVHQVRVWGRFGDFDFTLRGQALAGNPKPSALTVYSLARAVLNHAAPLAL